MANPKLVVPAPTSLDQIESLDFKLESTSLQNEVEKKFDAKVINALKKIAFYISQVGFSIDEACTLSNVDPEQFRLLMDTEPLIRKVVDIKELEYKRYLMHTVSIRAREDDKLAQWLLERRFPDEFATGKNKPADGRDMLFEAIEFIQKSGDRNPLIKETSGRALTVRLSHPSSGKRTLGEKIKAIKDVLV